MIGDTATRLRNLAMRLKTGQYDGTDIMQAWIALRQFADLQWQPIETAPKDGTLIILGGGEFQRPVFAWWTPRGYWAGDQRGLYEAIPYKATHWMPPPPEPETSEGTEAPL